MHHGSARRHQAAFRLGPRFRFLWLVALLIVGCNSDDGESSGAAEPAEPFDGFALGPFVDGSDPDLGASVDASTVSSLMTLLSDLDVGALRTFGATHGLEHAATFAHAMGFELAQGVWLDGDPVSNELEIQAAIGIAQAGLADVVVVGSEVLLRGDLTEAELIGYIERVRAEVPDDVLVTYAGVYFEYLRRPRLIEAVDIICANFYPFWQGIALEQAVAAIDAWFEALEGVAAGTPIRVCESGWPTDGSAVRDAVPGLERSIDYFVDFLSWAESRGVRYYYFQAFDEPWKSRLEGDVGDHWGVLDSFGNLKPGMEGPLQNGRRVANDWSGERLVGGPGEPEIEFTLLPPLGSHQDLEGRVRHVNPTVHAIAVYIRVSGRWWTKPTFASPSTLINPDGTWRTDITTGGSDSQATAIAAFLLPLGVNPPRAAGASALPSELELTAVATLIVTR